MKVYILVDDNNIIRCMASEDCNLHRDKLYMKKYYVESQGIVGDEYNAKTNTWIKRPENYPQPTEEEIREAKIQAEMDKIVREQAIKNLQDRGEI